MAIDKEETKKSLFGGLKSNTTPEVPKIATSEVSEFVSYEHPKSQTSEKTLSVLPKWKTLEKVTAMISTRQLDAIDQITRDAMRNRHKIPHTNRERITANTVLRALLDILADKLPLVEVPPLNNEESVKDWLTLLLKKEA
jgi:hypothetical protein